jgi:predicted nucleic acid-binding protein
VRAFVDTNVLLYSISRDPGERRKQEIAVALLQRDDLALSVQVLQEFYVQATRQSRADAIAHADARDLITGWTRFPVVDVDQALMLRAMEIKDAFVLSYWDSAVIAAAERAGCETLLSEDLNHGQKIGRVRIDNPFLE